jgi:hypothetical protein
MVAPLGRPVTEWLSGRDYTDRQDGQAKVRDRCRIHAAFTHRDPIQGQAVMRSAAEAGWSLARQQRYFDWATEVVDQARGVNPRLERMFDRLYRHRPVQLPADHVRAAPASAARRIGLPVGGP